MFGMGTGVAPPVWPPGTFNTEQVFTAFHRVIVEDHVYQEQRMLNRTTD